MLQLSYLFEDKPLIPGTEPSHYTTLNVVSGGSHLYGQIMWPDGTYEEKRPCVILFHGFPGSARNDDLAHALCRIGCVVLIPHHRGAWGSEGKYLPSNCVEDVVNVANWVQTEEDIEKYHIDPEAIFLAGHSMGSNSVLQAGRRLPWVRGLILLTPYDPTYAVRTDQLGLLHWLLPAGALLHTDGEQALFDDIVSHAEEWNFETAAKELGDRNVYIATGTLDTVAPGEAMAEPLWNVLSALPESGAIHTWDTFPAAHGVLGYRQALIRAVAEFMDQSLSR